MSTEKKCTRCIDHFREQKKRLELIQDLKYKSETMFHAMLKTQACSMLRDLGEGTEMETIVKTEVSVEGVGVVDVVGLIGEVSIAVECGNTKPDKILAISEHFDIVLHIPFCYTWGTLVKLDMDELQHRIAVALFDKGLKKRGISGYELYKSICLEKGECSLPSGRNGFPEEAMQIADFSENQIKKK